MLPDRVSNPGPLTYESGALPIALRGPALKTAKTLWSFGRSEFNRVETSEYTFRGYNSVIFLLTSLFNSKRKDCFSGSKFFARTMLPREGYRNLQKLFPFVKR